MDRATKLIVVGWACTALAAEIWLLGGWRLPLFALSAFTLAAVLTAFDRRAIAFVLALTYLCPALIYLYTGRRFVLYDAVWMAALLGALAPASVRTGWHIPGPWRGALVCWALVVGVGASIVVVREVDFTPALIHVSTIANTARGGWPAFIVRFVLHSSLVLVLGILWFDWLFGMPRIDFHELVAGPLAASALGMAVVAIYQLFVNVRFMNPTVYAGLGRASGTLFDANVCGTVAALWIGGAVLWANQLGRWRPHVAVAGMTIGWLTVWASGSRTAFAAAVLVTAFSLVTLYTERRRQSGGRALPLVAITAAGLLGLVAFLATADLGVVGPARRLWATLPEPSVESVRTAALEMWNRNDYGSASTAMIREFPWFGVGVGSFQNLLPEFAAPMEGRRLPPDNAQNWYRHQFAEFGLFGSLAWIAWVVLFAVFVMKGRKDAPPAAWTARGVLVALALISLLGMPGQETSVAITFWTMAFWYVWLVGAPPPAPIRLPAWAAIAVALAVYAAGTVWAAGNELRVPVRATRGGWAYSYGFYPPERGEGGGEYRWTEQRAVAVIDAPQRWLALTVSVNPFKIAGGSSASGISNQPIRPVDVKVWRDRQLVVAEHLTSTAPVTQYISVPGGRQRVMLETWVSRVIRPRDIGIADDRERGLLVKWEFLAALPAGAAPHAGRR